MKNTTERDRFLKAAKNVDVVIWPILDSRGGGWKAVTSDETFALANTHRELVSKLNAAGMTWVDGIL